MSRTLLELLAVGLLILAKKLSSGAAELGALLAGSSFFGRRSRLERFRFGARGGALVLARLRTEVLRANPGDACAGAEPSFSYFAELLAVCATRCAGRLMARVGDLARGLTKPPTLRVPSRAVDATDVVDAVELRKEGRVGFVVPFV